MKNLAVLLAAASLLSACTVVPETSARRDSGPAQVASAPAARGPALTQRPLAVRPEAAQCLTQLNQAGAQFTPVSDAYFGNGCSTVGTVQLAALSGDNARLNVSNIGPVQCGVGSAFAAWARYGVDRAAQQILGSALVRIETMGSYNCRNVAGSDRRSAHATANAIDIAAFVLADGRRITITGDWHGGTPAERQFLSAIHTSACKRFGTVLGPAYNAAHRDHLHLELSGSTFCR